MQTVRHDFHHLPAAAAAAVHYTRALLLQPFSSTKKNQLLLAIDSKSISL